MIAKEEVALEVDRMLRDTWHTLEESIWHVNKHCDEVEAKNYREKIGNLFYILVFELMEPLYEEHPKLRPSGWDDQ